MKPMILSIFIAIAATSSLSERIADLKCKDYKTTTINGDSILKEFPHMVLLSSNKHPSIRCYGALISESYVLTTAHCLNAPKPVQSVLLGSQHSQKLDDGSTTVNILKMIPHPEYLPALHQNDIGLVQIEPISAFTETIRPACLYTGVVKDDQILEDAVWDIKEKQSLAKFETEIVPFSECKSLYKMKNFDLKADIHLCGYPKHQNISQEQRHNGGVTHISDNGHWKIAAIDAFGPRIVTAASPEVYTRLSPYMEWIEKTVWG